MVQAGRQDDNGCHAVVWFPSIAGSSEPKVTPLFTALCLLVSSDANCRASSLFAVLELNGFYP